MRRALNLAFDFEWSRENLFYGQYTRSRSYFNNSELEAKGLPSPEELAMLEPLKDKLPPEVFTTEYSNPVNNNAAGAPQEFARGAKPAGGSRMEISLGRLQPCLEERQGRSLHARLPALLARL